MASPNLGTIDLLIRAGRLPEARSQVRKIAPRRLSRSDRCRLAGLANEALLPGRAALLVRRVFEPDGAPATDAEILEGGIAMTRLGAYRTAIELLSKVDTRALPKAASSLALARFRCWEWSATIDPLTQALRSPTLAPEDRAWLLVRLGTA